MYWNNLKKNKCPKCNTDLDWRELTYGTGYVCKNIKCDFVIGENKFKRIVNNIVNKEFS